MPYVKQLPKYAYIQTEKMVVDINQERWQASNLNQDGV